MSRLRGRYDHKTELYNTLLLDRVNSRIVVFGALRRDMSRLYKKGAIANFRKIKLKNHGANPRFRRAACTWASVALTMCGTADSG